MENDMPVMEQKSSFKLTKNAKGEYQWEAKVYHEDPEEIKKQIEHIDNWARTKYGGEDGNSTTNRK